MKEKEYFVYMFFEKETNEIIYVGKATGAKGLALYGRVSSHSREAKFQPYLGRYYVRALPLENQAQATGIELLWIDFYKPVLNNASKYETGGQYTVHAEKDMLPYENYEKDRLAYFKMLRGDSGIDNKREAIYKRKYEEAVYELRCAEIFLDSVKKFVAFLKAGNLPENNRYAIDTTSLFDLKIYKGHCTEAVFLGFEITESECIGRYRPELIGDIIEHAVPQTEMLLQEKQFRVDEAERIYQLFLTQ